MRRPADQERLYVEAILATYSSLPGAPPRSSRRDRQLARELCRRCVPLRTVRSALLLATARRTLRSGPPLPPVRTLHYFLPVIEELLAQPIEPGYIEYLDARLKSLASQKRASWRAVTADHSLCLPRAPVPPASRERVPDRSDVELAATSWLSARAGRRSPA